MTEKHITEEFSDRYKRIDDANRESWYMTDNDRPISVIMSLHSVGNPREKVEKGMSDGDSRY